MKLYLALISIFLFSIGHTFAQTVYFEGHISSDTTWQADTVFITGHVQLAEYKKLTIEAGTAIVFTGHYTLEAYGSIHAAGSLNDSIVFTVANNMNHPDTATTEGGWNGIRLLPRSYNDTSFFSFCSFSYGKAVMPQSLWNDENLYNHGGSILCSNCGTLIVENSNFERNLAKRNGASIFAENSMALQVENSRFYANRAYYKGGGICAFSVDFINIENNLFKKDTAWYINYWYAYGDSLGGFDQSGGGGGVYIKVSNPTINHHTAFVINNKFFNNKSISGSAIAEHYPYAYIIGNIMCNNDGATLHSMFPGTHPVIANNIAINNYFFTFSGVDVLSENGIVVNNIFWGNRGQQGNKPQFRSGFHNYDPPFVAFNIIEDGEIWEGNLYDNPLFVNPTAGTGLGHDGSLADWSLQDDSPAVNTGTPDTTGLNIPAFDILGNPRIFGGRIDMGAIENQNVWVSLPENPLVNARPLAAPNPFRNAFTVELYGPEKVKRITVYNQTGTPVRQMETLWHDGLVHIDMDGFAAGLYVLVVEYENGRVRTEKMVKM